MNALAIATMVLDMIPKLVITSTRVYQLIQDTNYMLKKMQEEDRDPTAEEWDSINKMIHDLSEELY